MHANAQDLERYLLGTLPEPDANRLHEHLSDCDACAQTLTGLNPGPDTIVQKLQEKTQPDQFEQEVECRAMLERIVSLGSDEGRPKTNITAEQSSSSQTLPTLREYQLVERLGAGGMGTVYRAVHTRLGKSVAIKVLSSDKLRNSAAVARFEREMRIIGQLEHPQIVRATDAGLVDGTHFLVMELVQGVDLEHLVRQRGPLPIPEACEIVRQAAIGLQYAFERGVIHRDLKPSNLMLGRAADGSVELKILDLGLALLDEPEQTVQEGLTSVGQLMGTPDYMSPEQGQDTHRVDIRSDIYSLGATLYKLLTGQSPLANPAHDTTMKKLVALATMEPPNIRTLRPDIPPALATLIHRMLAKRAEDRPATPAEAGQLIARFSAGANLSTLLDEKRPANAIQLVRIASTDRSCHRWRIGVATFSVALLLAAIVFKFATRDGVITVELASEQPVSSIQVDGRSVEWTLGDDPRSHRFRVRPGRVTSIVLVASDGAKITAQIPPTGLTVSAGQPYTLTASLPKPTKPSILQPTGTSIDRAVATWAHQMGGRVGLSLNVSGYADISADAELPAGDFNLVVLDLSEQAVSDADLSQLDGLKSLSLLMLHSTAVTDQGLAGLGDLPLLRGLYFGHSQLTDAGLKTVAERFPHLEVLHVGYSRISDAGIESLLDCRRLTELRIEAPGITDQSLSALSKMQNLRTLNLIDSRVSASGIDQLRAALPGCKIESNYGVFEPSAIGPPTDRSVAEWAHAIGAKLMLRMVPTKDYQSIPSGNPLPDRPFELIDLNLTRRPIHDRDLSRIDGLTACSSLGLAGTAITDAGLANLGHLPQLKTISIGETQITGAGLKVLAAKYPTLTVFHAGKAKITDDGIRELLMGPKLVELRLDDLPLTDQSVEVLGQLKVLRILSLKATKLTRPGLERLHAALPACRIDSDFGVLEYSEPGDYALEFHFPALVTVPTLKYDGGPLTVEMTMRPASSAHFSLAIIGKSRVLFWRNEEWQGVKLDHDGQTLGAIVNQAVPLDRDVRMACTFDGDSLLYFLDGKVVARGNTIPQEPQRPAGGYFGGYVEPSYRGRMDELRVSKVARYTGDYVPSTRFETDADTVALYHFDEGHGTVLNDSSGNDHHGTIRGAVWVKGDP